MSEAQANHWKNLPATAENSQRTYHDSTDMISSVSAYKLQAFTVSNDDLMQAIQTLLELSLVSCIQSWLITKQCQSFTVSTTSPLSASPGNTILQHLLAWGIIVDTNTNHVPFTALPALQPLMTFLVTSRNMHIQSRSVGDAQMRWTTGASTTCQTSTFYGRREWERVGEHSDDVKNDLLIIHYLPALLMRWRLLNN